MSIALLFNAFDNVEATSGKKDKLALLEAIATSPKLNPLAQTYFSVAMDWYRIYGVGEKSLDAEDDIDEVFFGAPKKKKAAVDPEDSWAAFLKLIARIENGGDNKPNKEEIKQFIAGVTDPQSNKWIVAALLKKTRMGVSEKTINKVWPGLIHYFEVQLADVLDDPASLFSSSAASAALKGAAKKKAEALPDHYFLEPKLDGIRAVCRVNTKTNKVKFFSRGGQSLNNTAPAGIDEYLLSRVSPNSDIVFDGELFGNNWNETSKVTSKGEGEADPELVKRLRFFVFDMLTGTEWDKKQCDRPYTVRREAIPFECMTKSDAKVVMTASHRCESAADIAKWYKHYLGLKFEGVMVKHPNAVYEMRRSTGWLKHKPLFTDEFEVVGKYEGEIKSKNEGRLGGLVIQITDKVTCNVGSGFSDEQREEFWKKPPIGQMAELEFKEKTPDGMLREPVFVRIRTDKRKND